MFYSLQTYFHLQYFGTWHSFDLQADAHVEILSSLFSLISSFCCFLIQKVHSHSKKNFHFSTTKSLLNISFVIQNHSPSWPDVGLMFLESLMSWWAWASDMICSQIWSKWMTFQTWADWRMSDCINGCIHEIIKDWLQEEIPFCGLKTGAESWFWSSLHQGPLDSHDSSQILSGHSSADDEVKVCRVY